MRFLKFRVDGVVFFMGWLCSLLVEVMMFCWFDDFFWVFMYRMYMKKGVFLINDLYYVRSFYVIVQFCLRDGCD